MILNSIPCCCCPCQPPNDYSLTVVVTNNNCSDCSIFSGTIALPKSISGLHPWECGYNSAAIGPFCDAHRSGPGSGTPFYAGYSLTITDLGGGLRLFEVKLEICTYSLDWPISPKCDGPFWKATVDGCTGAFVLNRTDTNIDFNCIWPATVTVTSL